jgi:hypothetical protein
MYIAIFFRYLCVCYKNIVLHNVDLYTAYLPNLSTNHTYDTVTEIIRNYLLTTISTINLPVGKGRLTIKGDNITAISEPIV